MKNNGLAVQFQDVILESDRDLYYDKSNIFYLKLIMFDRQGGSYVKRYSENFISGVIKSIV